MLTFALNSRMPCQLLYSGVAHTHRYAPVPGCPSPAWPTVRGLEKRKSDGSNGSTVESGDEVGEAATVVATVA